MLSDEEKKAIDSLKVISEYAGDNYLAKEHRRKLKMLIELVEKQSKEIEELKNGQIDFWISDKEIEERIRNKFVSKEESEQKERKAYIKGTNDADELCNKKWKDKIKAKIEELEKQDKESKLSHNYLVIPVLQSLLEKE